MSDFWDWFFKGWAFTAGACVMLSLTLLTTALIKDDPPRDDSDPPGGRSGVTVITDHKTGLQYLKAPGGLYPRMGTNGEQMSAGKSK